jgi:hypothetical protein
VRVFLVLPAPAGEAAVDVEAAAEQGEDRFLVPLLVFGDEDGLLARHEQPGLLGEDHEAGLGEGDHLAGAFRRAWGGRTHQEEAPLVGQEGAGAVEQGWQGRVCVRQQEHEGVEGAAAGLPFFQQRLLGEGGACILQDPGQLLRDRTLPGSPGEQHAAAGGDQGGQALRGWRFPGAAGDGWFLWFV